MPGLCEIRVALPYSLVLLGIVVHVQAALLNKDLLRFITGLEALMDRPAVAAHLGSPISVYGDPHQLQSILAQLTGGTESSEKLHFYYMGGSITQGYTGHDSMAHNVTYKGWVEAWFEKHYPGKTRHEMRAKSATTSSWAAACVDSVVEQDADVVFVEYTTNDLHAIRGEVETAIDNPKRRGTERLLRRLLTYDKTPAVVVLHTWAPKVLDEWTQSTTHNDFYTTFEDYWDILLKYYGIPSLSMRNTMHALVQAEEAGFGLDEMWGDNLHLTTTGHALAGYIILDYIELQIMLGRQLGNKLADYVTDGVLPEPMFLHNHHHKGLCGQGSALKEQVVWKDQGWEWDQELHEGRDSKEGYMADGVFGHRLAIRVPAEALKDLESTNYTAHLGMQKSWKPYGTVAVRCNPGRCACDAFEVDLHDKEARTTMQVMTDFILAAGTMPSGADSECIVEVEILEKTSSAGRYAKVMSLGVEPERGGVGNDP